MNGEPAAQERLDTLAKVSGGVLTATTVVDLLQRIVEAAGELTGARVSAAGYDCVNGKFTVVAGAWTEGNAPCEPAGTFELECSGRFMDLLGGRPSFRLTETELRNRPGWRLPDGRVALAGLLGARIAGPDGQASGLLLVSDKGSADFTPEDEALLVQLATLASVGVLHIEARGQAEAHSQELDRLHVEREHLLDKTNQALEQGRHELQLLSRSLVEMQEAERTAVARELHDGTGQLLTSLIVGLGILERRFGGSAEATAHIAYLKSTAQEILEHVHRLGAELRPASLEKLGLGPALRQYVERFGYDEGLQIQFELSGPGRGRLPQPIETAIYRIVQEALTNVARHATARNVGLVLTHHDGMVTAIVEDDGRGFDPQNPDNQARLGLLGMRQRAEMFGGSLTIESAPGAGTTVFAEIPCCQPVLA